MLIFRSIASGFRRSLGSPGIAVLLWVVNFAIAVPASLAVGASIHSSVATSRVHIDLERGFDMGWFDEYTAGAGRLEKTFTPTVAGVGAFLTNLESWVTGTLFQETPALLGLGAVFALVWILLFGGVLDGLARPQEKPSVGRFFGAGGRFFPRFLRLAVLSWVLYATIYLLFRWAYGRLAEITRDVTSETTVLSYSLVAVGLAAILLITVHVGFTYAKIATVIEDRPGMLRAAAHGMGFVLRNPGRCLGLFGLVAFLSLVLLALYATVAPEAGPSTWIGVALAFVLGQAFLLTRLLVWVALVGGEMELYESLRRRD